ncbi:MAG: transporter permease, partial [Paenibacillus sp.]|nr:transporter permease [Paenibacillus sp.]
MLTYIGRRLLQLIPLLAAISMVVFLIIQMPPGDFLTTYVDQLKLSGTDVAESTIIHLTAQYGLNEPIYVQYWIWIKNMILHGDMGTSFQWNLPVSQVIGERLALTMVISVISLVLVWVIAIPVGIYSATHQYS